MKMMIKSLFLAVFLPSTAVAWKECDGGGICPDRNTCCPTLTTGVAACITTKHDNSGSCCSLSGKTGCGEGFECSYADGLPFCRKVVNQTDIPDRLPRYQSCTLPDEALTQVHGLPVPENPDKEFAYVSTMGAVDTSHPDLKKRQAQVETIVVMVHGSGRNVGDYLCTTNSALPASQRDPATSKMMVIAPWFLTEVDPLVQLYNRTNATKPLRWGEFGPIFHTWRYGADSINLHQKEPVSSYAVMDRLLETILQEKASRFPALKNVVLAGHSAGGQYTQRWVLLSSVPDMFDDCKSDSIHLRVIVANPRSFCWLDERRMIDGELQLPSEADIEKCPIYNEWQWGLDEGGYLDTPYKTRAVNAVGIPALIERYATRDLVYLAGEEDTIPNGDCQDLLQGAFRRERSANFFASLSQIYDKLIHHRLVVQGVPHDHALMFQSPEGQLALFGPFLKSEPEDEAGKVALD